MNIRTTWQLAFTAVACTSIIFNMQAQADDMGRLSGGVACESTASVLQPELRGFIDSDCQPVLQRLRNWRTIQEVAMVSSINSKTARIGNLVEAKLTQDLLFGSKFIASKDCLVRGHIVAIGAPRMFVTSVISGDRRMNSRGFVAVEFDEIIDYDGRRLPIQGTPCKQKNQWHTPRSDGRAVEVDRQGRIVKSEEVLTGALKVASISARVVTSAPLPGPIIIGALAGPVAMGVIGAASPAIAYNRPLAENEDHSRVKAMTYAFVTNLPGVALIQKGNYVVVSPGDRLMIDLCFKETGYKLPPVQSITARNTEKTIH